MKKLQVIIICTLLLMGCKATKNTANTGTVTNRSSKEVINKHYKEFTKFKTLKSTLKIRYVDEDRDDLITADLRIEKDKKIWISAKLAFITIAKMEITPEKISYYNKADRTYFEGDFRLLSKWLGVALDFDQVQNLLLAQAVLDLKEQKYRINLDPDSYLLYPKKQTDLFDYFVRINPTNFKIFNQEISQPKELRLLTVEYPLYQNIENTILPKMINITALEKTKETKIDIEYRNVSLNQKLRFPFKLPDNYKALTFE